MTVLTIDFETRSAADLKRVGVYEYALHPSTGVWCAAYALDDGPVQLWREGEPCPAEIVDHVVTGGELHAWNAAFERIIWRDVLGPRYGWPVPALVQWHCTMVSALAMALPGRLEDCALALGTGVEKDAKGHRLMLQMAKPRRIEPALIPCRNCHGKGDTYLGGACRRCRDGFVPDPAGEVRYVWWEDQGRRERLYAYCRQDVEAERAIRARLLPLRPQEREVWLLDQRINDRGVRIDRELCQQAKKVVAGAVKRLDAEMREVTGGEVKACSNVAALTAWLAARGVEADSLAKDQLGDLLLRQDLPTDARRALELRQEAAKTSTAKIDVMLLRSESDGRMRGNLQYHGASTGRWAARGAQLQNLPRPKLDEPEKAIPALMSGDVDLVDMIWGGPMQVVSDCIRSMIVAGP